jgi:hypothetical protein
MYHYVLSFQLYVLSFLFSFYLSSLLITNKYAKQDTTEPDKLEQEMIEHCNNYMFQFKYLDELEALDICYNNGVNKENTTTLEIPFLNNKVVMFYDTERSAFCYYTKGEVIYKYLNVACRKYVIEHNCRHLYLDVESKESNVEPINVAPIKPINNLFVNSFFVKKSEKTLLVKNINKFISVGSLEDYEKTLLSKVNVKNVSFSDYLILQKTLQTASSASS